MLEPMRNDSFEVYFKLEDNDKVVGVTIIDFNAIKVLHVLPDDVDTLARLNLLDRITPGVLTNVLGYKSTDWRNL